MVEGIQRRTMRLNQGMAGLLAKLKIDLSDERQFLDFEVEHDLIETNGSILLRNEYLQSAHMALNDYQDRAGYECFVNHVHIACRPEKRDMLSSLAHIFWLRESLEKQFPDRAFVIITPFSDGECTVRFHQSRNNERWLADDLDKYESEAILEITLRSAK
jgi:hypothetical protein